jgi:hypothetical protein
VTAVEIKTANADFMDPAPREFKRLSHSKGTLNQAVCRPVNPIALHRTGTRAATPAMALRHFQPQHSAPPSLPHPATRMH